MVELITSVAGKLAVFTQSGFTGESIVLLLGGGNAKQISLRLVENGDFLIVVDNNGGEAKQFEFNLNPGVIHVLPVLGEQIPDGFTAEEWRQIVGSDHRAYLIPRH